jgi:hypothetical protein
VQRSLQLQMRKPSIETMGTVDCEQGMEGWYDAAVCGLVREVVGVYSVSSIMCVPEIGIRRPFALDPRGSGLLFFMFVHTPRPGAPAQPATAVAIGCAVPPVWENSMPCATEGFSRAPAECGRERQPSGHHHRCLILLSPCASAPVFRPSQVSPCSLRSLLEVGWCKVEFRISQTLFGRPG